MSALPWQLIHLHGQRQDSETLPKLMGLVSPWGQSLPEGDRYYGGGFESLVYRGNCSNFPGTEPIGTFPELHTLFL